MLAHNLATLSFLLSFGLTASAAVLPPPATTLDPFASLVLKRQALVSPTTSFSLSFGAEVIPTECETSCASTIPIYKSCAANDLDRCLKICGEEEYDAMMRCVNCELVFEPARRSNPARYYQEEQSGMREILGSCFARGKYFAPNVTLVTYDQVLAAINGTAALPANSIASPSGAALRLDGGRELVFLVASVVLSSAGFAL
ncbi:hypothetical protein BDY24DRAFT_400815 [Mrakia frigida]|uniref:uncharacterized protein n=1 Tax=Mrakia frigida TaxID=29902 RepID=UPI003FCBFAED